MEDTLNSIVGWLQKLEGLPAIALSWLVCWAVGYALRFIKRFPNEGIPVAVILFGGLFYPLIADANNTLTLRVWIVRNAGLGLIVGASAWLLHRYVLTRIEDKFPAIGALLGADTGDTKRFTRAQLGIAPAVPAGRLPTPPPKSFPPTALAFLVVSLVLLSGCKTTLAPGGAYAPATYTTNALGQITTNQVVLPDMAFYRTEAAFKTAYDLLNGVFTWERENRLVLWKISPDIKHGLDAIRPTAAAVAKQYGIARLAYMATPTPAGLDLMNTILAKVQQLQTAANAIQINSIPK